MVFDWLKKSFRKEELDAQHVYALVLSGGGTRAAYQVGALKALYEYYDNHLPYEIIIGSSMGAVNGVILSAALRGGSESAINVLEKVWLERTFENTFGGSLSFTLLRSIRIAFMQYLSPGPNSTSASIFDPTPLRQRIDEILFDFGGASVDEHPMNLRTVGVMTTMDGDTRKGLLIANVDQRAKEQLLMQGAQFDVHEVNHLSSSHAFASAALPAVLPPVELTLDEKKVKLVDGGISDNIPVDAAVRYGANHVTLLDTSGKRWWHDHYERPYDTAEPWEPQAEEGAFCLTPLFLKEICNQAAFGPILKDSLGTSTKDNIRALGPTWPIYKLIEKKMGETVALEIMTYAVIHPPYIKALLDLGYNEARQMLGKKAQN